ncbi:MAG TPA: NAD-dependent epimerase/dehydratase family protein [Actinomycetota bacterium]|nr:NAD-dependent epimerase/dehydratase family protein [Actinomycetota bacterium]
MRAFVTGATGFIGGHLAEKLRSRGDDVVALVRNRDKAAKLRDIGCELVQGDLSDEAAIQNGVTGCDSVFHVGAVYEVGIPASKRPAMYDANVRGTERVLDAAARAQVGRIVYVSTINVFGNTRGKIVDEEYRRPSDDFLSYYDETKYLAHQVALDRIRRGYPIVIAQPGGVYGPGDTSQIANFVDLIRRGRLKALTFPETGLNFLHIEDCVDGIVLVHDKGRLGESYVLGGEITNIGDAVKRVATILRRKPPRVVIPPAMVKMSIPLGPLIGRVMGVGPNLRELIKAADGVTYWATDAKARRELGYSPRDLDTGLRQYLTSA